MSEEENKGVAEVETEAATAQATESDSAHDERSEAAKKEQSRKRNDSEYNWAEARRKMQELERQNHELKEAFTKSTKSASQEEDDLSKLGDDEIVTKGQVKKLASRMAKEIAQDVIKQREAATVDERLQLKYSDYAEVVSPENIQLLKETEPELALSLYHTPDPYAQGVAAYKLLKKIGVSPKETNALEKKKAMENSNKPVSVQAVAKQSALGNAHLFENGLTDSVKKQLWAEMQQAMKG